MEEGGESCLIRNHTPITGCVVREEHGIPEPVMGQHPIERFARTDLFTESKTTAAQSDTQGYGVDEPEGCRQVTPCPIVTAAIQIRKELRQTQASFARYLKISPRTLRDWEQGRRQPSGAAVTLLEWVVENPEWIRDMDRKAKAEARMRRLMGE